jgi:nitroreductase
MELEAAIHSRRAVRDYSNEPIENATLAGLIDAAIEAPSAINAQSWHFTVIQDRELLRRISSQSKAFVLASPPGGVSREHLQHLLVDSEFDIFYHAPALVLISSIKTGAWAVEDCSLTAENLMLAACGQGLGSCWIGFAQGRLTTAEGKAALGLPSEYLPVAPIIIGRPKSVPLAVRRDKPQIKWTNGYEQQVRIGGAPGAMKLSPRDWLLRGWLFGACCAHTGNDECQRGNDIVQQACSTCHVAGRNQKIAPALGEPVPSFLDIAARPSTTAKSLHDFLLTTHWD